jgi:eukaryotic-like serine/threonine-protein kinase
MELGSSAMRRRGVFGGWPVRAEMVEQASVTDESAVTVEETRPAGLPPGAPFERPHDRELWPWLLVLLILVLGGVAAAYFFTRNDNGARSQGVATTAVQATTPQPPASTTRTAPGSARVTVPRLVGLTAPSALNRLRGLGLTGTTRNVFSEKPPNQVVAQAPGATRKLAKGASVTLTVSKGPKAAPVPDVIGQTVADALGTLRAQGLNTRVVRVPNQAPAGQVVAQDPKPGAKTQPLVIVRLNVADGKRAATTETAAPTTTTTPAAPSRLVRVPDLEGRKLVDARRLLRKGGLIIEIRRVPNAQPVGTVVAQAKKQGTRLTRGSHLLVTVSMGRPQSASPSTSGSGNPGSTSTAPVSVPNVVSEDETTAIQDIQSAGLTVRVVDRDTTDVSQDGIVLEQSPTAGSSTKPDSTVTIYVGRYTSS